MGEEFRLARHCVAVPTPTLRDFLSVVFRRRRVWSATLLLIFLGTMLYGWLAPSYEAHMKFLVRHGRIDPVLSPAPTQAPQFDRGEVSEEDLNSEVELLESDEVLRDVVAATGLAERGAWLSKVRGEKDEEKTARAVRRLSKQLRIEAVKKSTVITVKYSSSRPELSDRVLKSLAASYIERHTLLRRPSGEAVFFERQVVQARQSLETAEARLVNFSRDRGVVSATLERDISLQKLGEADTTDRQTRVAVAETEKRLRTLELKVPTLPERITTQVRNLDNPELLEKLKSTLLELQLKRTELLTKLEPTHRWVREVDRQIAETQMSISNEDKSPLRDQTTEPDPNREWAKSEAVKAQVELSGLLTRQSRIHSMVKDYREAAEHLGERAIEQEGLLRDIKSEEAHYLLYVNKLEEARMGDALDQGKLLNVTMAEQSRVPILPALSMWGFGAIGLFAGGGIGTGLTLTLDYLDPTFRTPDDILTYLGVPVLASLPEQL